MIGEMVLTVAAILWFIDLIPQVYKTYKTKSAKDLSLISVGLGLLAYFFFQLGNYLVGEYFYFMIYILPALMVLLLFLLMLKYKS